MNAFILWLAQGFGSGRIPFGPGTFGSIVGLFWFALLLCAKSPAVFVLGICLSIPLSVWLSASAEKILGKTDPGSIVIDEIIAIPLCFGTWLAHIYARQESWPGAEYFFSSPKWPITLAVFILFRVFDIAKPWPVRSSQKLPGGWGVTMDDVLAAVYVNVVVCLVAWFKPGWF
jgi:phosphatidylglycerophosphatase A